MVSVLIDNATVSSVQRALGKAQLRDVGIIDVEHAALGRFSEAVLLCDNVVVPDNYKQKFTDARKKLLGELGVKFKEVPNPLDDSLNKIAHGLAEPWKDAYKEGQDRDLFQDYFKQINAFSNFIWEHSSSEFFLVFRAHGIEKESPLIEALLASPKDEELGKDLKIYAADGKVVHWEKMSPHVQRMLGVMGWLGHQYIWHQAFAAQHDLVYMPHPLREFFANDFLARVNMGAGNAVYFDNAFTTGMAKFQGTLKEGLERIGVSAGVSEFSMPPLLPLLVRDSSSGSDFIKILSQYRDESRVKELRELLSSIRDEADIGNYRLVQRLISDIESIGKNFLLERGVGERFLKVTPPTKLVGIKIEGDDSGVRMRIPSILYRQFFFNRRYRAFVRDIMAELAAPSKYGSIKTKMNSWAWLANGWPKGPSEAFYAKKYRFPSLFHKPLDSNVQWKD